MPKTILLIENDTPFAEEMSGALEAMGYQVRVTGDGKDGLELARDLRPDAIVLCVELPKLSGYSICNKLKKDEALKAIPLILTSSEATDEVFDDHKKLKVRAEDYLIKPFVSATLFDRIAALVGVPEAGPSGEAPGVGAPTVSTESDDEEVVSLEDELGLEPFAGEPGEELPTLDLDSLPDEPVAPSIGGGDLDADLKLLDDAFDGLSAPMARAAAEPAMESARKPDLLISRVPAETDASVASEAIERAMGVDRPVTSEDLEAASASLPGEDEAGARADLGDLGDEADLALSALVEVPGSSAPSAFEALDALGSIDGLSPSVTIPEPSPGRGPVTGGVEVDAVAGASARDLERLESELAEHRSALGARDEALRDLKAKLEETESALGEKEAEAASLKARGDTLATQAKKAETEVRAAREEARVATEHARAAEARSEGAEARASAAEGRATAAEQEAVTQRRAAEQSAATLAARSVELATALASAARLVEVEHEAERLRNDLAGARSDADAARTEVEKRTTELKRRISELEAANAKNEERVVKAYLKIKGDEKLRDKARKALAISLQLLEEGLPSESPGEKRTRPVPE